MQWWDAPFLDIYFCNNQSIVYGRSFHYGMSASAGDERQTPNESLNKQYQLCSSLNSTEIYDLYCYSAGEMIIKLYIGWCTCTQYWAPYPSNYPPFLFLSLQISLSSKLRRFHGNNHEILIELKCLFRIENKWYECMQLGRFLNTFIGGWL